MKKHLFFLYMGISALVCFAVILGIFFFNKEDNIEDEVFSEAVFEPNLIIDSGHYSHEMPYFDILVPEGYSVGNFFEGEGEVVLLQKEDDSTKGVQIFITYLDEEGPLTIERIKNDLPELEMGRPAQVIVGKDIQGVGFFDEENIANAWFVEGGYLYQVSASGDLANMMGEMLSSFKVQ